ncbi:cytochrome c nitrite reductase pentaheme subunit [bacterium BMS3Abin07]|nr:cytochrome c nitrite reductase pentaheme subunit [bacterium BMS3Abin07]GBE32837.1 cytochrome c nitrite reductase pentaheme subunit [bacterium BMS3Bbin05]HDL21263.1 DmsE family decaheme c-type cytochrome [Nitrospirota bacterium]HDZ87493.1 DmsE family decaheme c-type cytochrome [Nitrospirota bacterium]
MTIIKSTLGLIGALIIIVAGCESLKSSKPILPMKEYEKMLIGRLDADYIGTRNCLSACHYHDKIRRDFEASTMGAQLSKKSGMPIVDCESCHGPGSLAVKGITPERVKRDASEGKQTACNYRTLINIKNLPPQAKSLICLNCHTANATFSLHNWNASEHAINDVTCIDCHNVHAGPDLIVRPRDTFRMCIKCHKDVEAQYSLPSHHPIHEKRVFCTDCHDPMGSTNENMLRGDSVKATCTRCHAEKEGPFIYEHAENTEDCTTCHNAHGSINNNLLKVQLPFLCLQCHPGHVISSSSSVDDKRLSYTRCTDCHSQIHGTDIPGADGTGTFTQ